jgi:hypothetical protein
MNSGEHRTNEGVVDSEGVTHGVQHVHPVLVADDSSLSYLRSIQPTTVVLTSR